VEFSGDSESESECVTSLSVDPFDFINQEDSAESFEEVIDENVEMAAEDEPGDDIPELEPEMAKPIQVKTAQKPIVLTPTGTPTYAQMARSRPTSECVVDEPVVEDPEVEDIVVEDIVEEAPHASVQSAPTVASVVKYKDKIAK